MGELIKIAESEIGRVVSARELHRILNIKTEFSKWCSRMFEYGFIENVDYSLVKIGERNAHNKIDYVFLFDMAKEVSMIQRTDEGRLVRQYFIACEKKLRSLATPSYQIENPIDRAKSWIAEQEQVLQLKEENKKLQFRSDFVDVAFETDGLFSMEEVCKINDLPYGRNTMLAKLRAKKVFLSSNTPIQKLINAGYFKVVEQIIEVKGFKKLISTTFATQKGLAYIYKLLKSS